MSQDDNVIIIKKVKTLTFSKLNYLLILPYETSKLFYHRLIYVLFTNRCKLSNFDNDGKLIDLKFMDYSSNDIKFQQTIFKFFKSNKELIKKMKQDIFIKSYLKKYKFRCLKN